jgi:hypothetical protein
MNARRDRRNHISLATLANSIPTKSERHQGIASSFYWSTNMTYGVSDRLPLQLSNLPSEMPDDPFERAARRIRRAALRGRDAPEQTTDPATIASIVASALPFSGIVEAAGYMPDFRGGAEPSLAENWRQGNRVASGLQVLGMVGGPLGIVAKAARKVPVGKWAKYAGKYPEVGPPALYDKVTGKKIEVGSLAEAEALLAEGKVYWGKNLTPEVEQRDRRAIQRDMDRNGYTPYLDPAKRADVDPTNYPASVDVSAKTMPKMPETAERIRDLYREHGAVDRLVQAYHDGKMLPNSREWHGLKQIEDEFIKEYGPTIGRERFKKDFVDPIAATTAGNSPRQNVLMAQYVTVENKAGRRLPENSYELPYPVGGRFAKSNLRAAQKYFDEGAVGFGAANPKRYSFSNRMLGHRDGHVIDERFSTAIDPRFRSPPYYGLASEVMGEAQKKARAADATEFGDAAWAALGRIGHNSGDIPLISEINESIERTHRLTGMPREEIVRRGVVRKEIPLYAVGALFAPAMGYGLTDPRDDSWPTREGQL